MSVHRSSLFAHRSSRAFTLVELFLTVGVLMIVLGLMMNLANRVRRESADKITRQVLARLVVLMNQYEQDNDALPPVQPLIESNYPSTEPRLQILARQNNGDFIRYLNLASLAKSGKPQDQSLTTSFGQTPADHGLLLDPWGSPIVFMPRQNPAIGMAPADAFFFVSAGPDRKFLSREDNVYSYEANGRE